MNWSARTSMPAGSRFVKTVSAPNRVLIAVGLMVMVAVMVTNVGVLMRVRVDVRDRVLVIERVCERVAVNERVAVLVRLLVAVNLVLMVGELVAVRVFVYDGCNVGKPMNTMVGRMIVGSLRVATTVFAMVAT